MWFLLLIIVIFLLLQTIHESPQLREVKRRYKILREYVKKTPDVPKKFKVIQYPILISGFKKPNGNEIGYNINKGGEIGICLKGTANQSFHVLIHELAHSTVNEYSHSKKFWDNFKELCDLCEKIGIYDPVDKNVKFCGRYIRE